VQSCRTAAPATAIEIDHLPLVHFGITCNLYAYSGSSSLLSTEPALEYCHEPCKRPWFTSELPLDSQTPFLSTLILPTYNAAAFIEVTVQRLCAFLNRHPEWLVMFVCDGCTDLTVEKLRDLIGPSHPRISILACEQNCGKGNALRRGLELGGTRYLVYTDVDLAYDPEEAVKIVKIMEAGADIAVANRVSEQSEYLISPRDFPTIYRRHLMSRSFNWWLRRMLPISSLDTQAGLKGMTDHAWKILGPQLNSDGFFFDVELLARAAVAGLQVGETPVYFRYVDPTTVRMIAHGWQMFKDTLRLRRQLRLGRKTTGVPGPTALRNAVEPAASP
jgi:glycosyltransferase involved in cell wall biosynthesis